MKLILRDRKSVRDSEPLVLIGTLGTKSSHDHIVELQAHGKRCVRVDPVTEYLDVGRDRDHSALGKSDTALCQSES